MSRVMAAEACPSISCTAFDVGAGGYSKAGCGVAQLVRRQSKQSDLLHSRIEEPRPELRIAQHAALWSGKHQIASWPQPRSGGSGC
jgi:hypothetical protein